MQGKISLLDNRKFLFWTLFTLTYYMFFLSYLTFTIVQSGGF